MVRNTAAERLLRGSHMLPAAAICKIIGLKIGLVREQKEQRCSRHRLAREKESGKLFLSLPFKR